MARNMAEKLTVDIEKQMKDYLVELYSHQMGIEYTYEEIDKPPKAVERINNGKTKK